MIGRWLTAFLIALGIGGSAAAGDLSTSALRPTPLGPTGVVAGVKPGDLPARIGFEGRRGAQKAVDMALLYGDGRSTGSFWVHGQETGEENTRSFPIDSDGRRIVKVVVEGPEGAIFKVELGGSAATDKTARAAAF